MSTMQAFEKVLSYELFKVSGIPVTTLELAEAALALLLTALLAHWVSRLCEHRLRRRIPMDAAALRSKCRGPETDPRRGRMRRSSFARSSCRPT